MAVGHVRKAAARWRKLTAVLDMDCDGLKKALITDSDGTLFRSPTTAVSKSEVFWGK